MSKRNNGRNRGPVPGPLNLGESSSPKSEKNPAGKSEGRTARNAGRAATKNVLPPAKQNTGAQENVQDNEAQRDKRLELESRLRALVIGHVMAKDVKKYLTSELRQDINDDLQIDNDKLQYEIQSIQDEYSRNSGDVKNLDFILNLLNIDDNGAKMLAGQLNDVAESIKTNRSNNTQHSNLDSVYVDALYDGSSMNIVSDLINTGTARIAMADGNLSTMTIGAIPDDSGDTLKKMPDNLTSDIGKGYDPYGMYSAGDKNIAGNIIDGHIIHADYVDRLMDLEEKLQNIPEDSRAKENPVQPVEDRHPSAAAAAPASNSVSNDNDPYKDFIPGTATYKTAAEMPSGPTDLFLTNEKKEPYPNPADSGPADSTTQPDPDANEVPEDQSTPAVKPVESVASEEKKPEETATFVPAIVISPDSMVTNSPVSVEDQKSPVEIQTLLRGSARNLMLSGVDEATAKSTLQAIFNERVPLGSPDRNLKYRENVLIPSVHIGVQRIVESMVKDDEELGGLGSFVSMKDGNIRLGNGIGDIFAIQLKENSNLTAQDIVDHIKSTEIRVVSNNQ